MPARLRSRRSSPANVNVHALDNLCDLGMFKKMEWPGIATTVGLALIATLIIVGAKDDFHLKDWQPFMVAVIALGGGATAYWGAMAKVTADTDRERRELDRKKIGLYLRLLYPIEKKNVRAEDVRKAISGSRLTARKIPPSAIRIVIPEEVEESWKNLELFPVEVAVALDVIRTELPMPSDCSILFLTTPSLRSRAWE